MVRTQLLRRAAYDYQAVTVIAGLAGSRRSRAWNVANPARVTGLSKMATSRYRNMQMAGLKCSCAGSSASVQVFKGNIFHERRRR